jgi:hypothetical protein
MANPEEPDIFSQSIFWVWFDISPVFTDFSPKNNEKKQAQCLH